MLLEGCLNPPQRQRWFAQETPCSDMHIQSAFNQHCVIRGPANVLEIYFVENLQTNDKLPRGTWRAWLSSSLQWKPVYQSPNVFFTLAIKRSRLLIKCGDADRYRSAWRRGWLNILARLERAQLGAWLAPATHWNCAISPQKNVHEERWDLRYILSVLLLTCQLVVTGRWLSGPNNGVGMRGRGIDKSSCLEMERPLKATRLLLPRY